MSILIHKNKRNKYWTPRRILRQEYKDYKNISWNQLDYHIRYEKALGIHTYHSCLCGQHMCRSVMCAECWKEFRRQLVLEHRQKDERKRSKKNMV